MNHVLSRRSWHALLRAAVAGLVGLLLWIGFAPAVVPVDAAGQQLLSKGKTYFFSGAAPHKSYPDPEGTKLTDGQVGSDAYYDRAWLGVWNAYPFAVTLDLDGCAVVGSVRAHLLAGTAGIRLPKRFEVRFSETGHTWSEAYVMEIDPTWPVPARALWLTFEGVTEAARYVEFYFEPDVAGHGGGHNLFISELEVYGVEHQGCDKPLRTVAGAREGTVPSDAAAVELSEQGPSRTIRKELLYGPSVMVSPRSFPYYQYRSPESIAEEIALRGYKSVHYVPGNETMVDGALIEAFHKEGLAVWVLSWVGRTYTVQGFPPQWEGWRQTVIRSNNTGAIPLSLYNKEYLEWKKAALAEMVTKYPVEGVGLVEVFFPNWDGLQSGVYGDIGPNAQRAFLERYGTEPPVFDDPNHPRYYTRVPELYKQWVDLRVETLTNFLDELVNGEGGLREVRPDVAVATWTVATDAPRALEKSREDFGEDTAAIVAAVKPDLHILQTNYPDWQKPDLPPDYIKNYQIFFNEVRRVDPDLPVGVQADIGSREPMLKGWDWIQAFEEAVWEAGYSTYTMYEHHIGRYMYEEPPVIMKAYRNEEGQVVLSFNKRIDFMTAREKERYTVRTDNGVELPVANVTVDGNRAILSLEGPEELVRSTLHIDVEGIKDTPQLFLLPRKEALVMEPQRIVVPAVMP